MRYVRGIKLGEKGISELENDFIQIFLERRKKNENKRYKKKKKNKEKRKKKAKHFHAKRSPSVNVAMQ
jgi:hypothetical protein